METHKRTSNAMYDNLSGGSPNGKDRKRQRLLKEDRPSIKEDRLSNLSDELVLRVLEHLSVQQLLRCQAVSRRFYRLAGDPQLWRGAFAQRFVLQETQRTPDSHISVSTTLAHRAAVWLNQSPAISQKQPTNWQRQYKIRHNLTRGDCSVHEVRISDQAQTPRTLIQVCGDIAITAGREGLRAWRIAGAAEEYKILASWPPQTSNPSATSVPASLSLAVSPGNTSQLVIAVGFEEGRFAIYHYDQSAREFRSVYEDTQAHGSELSAIAISLPFLATMHSSQCLNVYQFTIEGQTPLAARRLSQPRTVSTLHSGSAWPPVNLSLQPDIVDVNGSGGVVISVVYATPKYLSGWSLGLQELRLYGDGTLKSTRQALNVDQAFLPLHENCHELSSATTGRFTTRPTTLAYSYPYILAAHPDNTLTLYKIHSSDKELVIEPERRLWGHTSSVSGVHIEPRLCKAVSVDVLGVDIRVWDLYEGLSCGHIRADSGQVSVKVTPGPIIYSTRTGTMDFVVEGDKVSSHSATVDYRTSGSTWVCFQKERLLMLQNAQGGAESLLIYDFS